MARFECILAAERDEDDWWGGSKSNAADAAVRDYAHYLYSHCDGWEWMYHESFDVVVRDERGAERLFSIGTEDEPVFYIDQIKGE